MSSPHHSEIVSWPSLLLSLTLLLPSKHNRTKPSEVTHGIKAGQLCSISSQPFPKKGKTILLSYLAYYVIFYRQTIWEKNIGNIFEVSEVEGCGSVVKPMLCSLSKQTVSGPMGLNRWDKDKLQARVASVWLGPCGVAARQFNPSNLCSVLLFENCFVIRVLKVITSKEQAFSLFKCNRVAELASNSGLDAECIISLLCLSHMAEATWSYRSLQVTGQATCSFLFEPWLNMTAS